MNPQTEQRRGRPDPTAIFENQGRASDTPTQAQAHTPRAHTEVVSPSGDLVTDDPNALVEAVVRPHHNYGGIPAGSVIKLPFKEFDGERAALCSRAEYARITALQATPGHQALQRQLQDMRAATSDATMRGLTPEKRAELEAARKQAAADDEREEARRRDIAQAAAAARPQPAAPAAIVTTGSIPETAEGLEQLIEARRQATEQAKHGANPRAAARLDALLAEEEIELRQAFLAAQTERAAAAARAQELAVMQPTTGPEAAQRWQEPNGAVVAQASVEQRLATLKGLLDKGLITEDVYRARQAAIVAEV